MVIKGVFDKISVYNQKKIEQDKDISLKKQAKSSNLSYSSDTVNLSSQGKVLNELIDTVKQGPDVRRDRIEDLKQKINSGEYKIDSKQIAKKIVDTEIDLYL